MNHICDSEWKVMKVLWNASPRLANEIVTETAGIGNKDQIIKENYHDKKI